MSPIDDHGRDITDIRAGEARLDHDSLGDTWDPTWAADGHLYTPGNDGSGWRRACHSNVFLNRLSGSGPLDLHGETVSAMSDFGGWAQRGPGDCTWKSSGCLALDGILYLALARHRYGTSSGDPFHRQTARDSSIIASRDGGRTWSRSGPECMARPMFPGRAFATPYFIHYGRDGAAPAVHGADTWVYAISNDGYWCNGDRYILGRVRRDRIARLDAADWSFYAGGSWTDDPGRAQAIIADPGRCGETGATWIPALRRYLLVAWHYLGDPVLDADATRFVFHQAPEPWGPWTPCGDLLNRPAGWYCPRVLACWQREDGGDVEVQVATGGDYYEMGRWYRFAMLPLRLRAGGRFPAPPIPPLATGILHGDARTVYEGRWQIIANRMRAADFTEHASDDPEAACTVRANGRRLRWYASKEQGHGIAAVALDGGAETLVDQYTYCAWPQHGRLLWDSGELPEGEHVLRIRVTGQRREGASGTRISHDRIEVT